MAATLRLVQGRWQAEAAAHTLSSAFQPILSLSHRRMVGYEALLRGRVGDGRPVAPMSLFDACPAEQLVAFDHAVATLHLRNFHLLSNASTHPLWLFVNLQPASFVQLCASSPSAAPALRLRGWEPGSLVIEITEDIAAQEHAFEACAEHARALGCLLALDDFGAGHSNFDRVWRLQPEIVKLDRSLVQRGARDRQAARVIAQMVSLLHECGSLVLMEGIETRDEAQLALDCDADLVQGYLFARPAPDFAADHDLAPVMDTVWADFSARSGTAARTEQDRIRPYAEAVEHAALSLAGHMPMADACRPFLGLPDAQLCYLLDEHGVQHGPSLTVTGFQAGTQQRFAPMRDTAQACWARRPYFLRALHAAGAVQLTRPYLSIQGAGLCVTVSVALQIGGRPMVLCGDVAWHH